ncbi:MAG: hypothetical protein H6819_11740 [Phycisphaerales bacterium]|nr:hypothetical protein [Phycisphaerales bacterium]MCB9854063.1 hypothetical protein [Phycisphaerales bacterium]MCB9864373.1 hypothetical protein [Phycisphaerales bacterium]
MNSAGTDAARPIIDLDRQLRANLDALRLSLPRTANLIQNAAPPESLRPTVGRDGAPTFTWTDGAGCRRWLGETTMPSVSEPALVEQFDIGDGNAILAGVGQGMAIRAIEKTLRRHQATFVVEPEAWRAACVFRLHDLSAMIRRRRLLVFVGPDAWDHLVEHLVEFPGYLTPERSLAWPWFSRADVRTLAERITRMQARVSERRLEATATTPDCLATQSRRILIASNSPDDRSHRWATQLAEAARSADAAVLCCVPDDPSMMHPATIDRRVARLNPTLSILVDCVPTRLAYRVGDGQICIVITHTNPLTDELIRQVPPDAGLRVRTPQQRDAAVAGGLNASRVALMQPGVPDDHSVPAADVTSLTGLIAICDWHGTEPENVGLHLGSHQRLWRFAKDWIAQRVDAYHDELAAEALAQAESSLDIVVQSDEVRAGLVSRIAETLGPQVVVESLLLQLIDAGIDVELRGSGWEKHPTLSAHAGIDQPDDELQGAGSATGSTKALLWMGTSRHADDRVLAWLAAGRPVFMRRVTGLMGETEGDVGWDAVMDCEKHAATFTTRQELLSTILEFRKAPAPFIERAANGAAYLKANHAWGRRLTDLLATNDAESGISEHDDE